MKIISFEEARARKCSREKADDGNMELQKQYQEFAQFCNRWYDEHVVRQDEDGKLVYKY